MRVRYIGSKAVQLGIPGGLLVEPGDEVELTDDQAAGLNSAVWEAVKTKPAAKKSTAKKSATKKSTKKGATQ